MSTETFNGEAASAGSASGGTGQVPPTGVIHDIGYRDYEGERVGRAGIVRALYGHSLRSAFGIGRGSRAKVVQTIAFVIMCLPAVVNAFTVSRTGAMAERYDDYIYNFQLILVLYLAATTPELISRDLRNRTLPLYFSRPPRRSDYPIAKIAALVTALLALTAIPELLLYAGTVSSQHSATEVWDQTKAFIPGLGIALGYSIVFAAIAAVLTCYTGRRAFATGAVAVVFFGSFILSGVMIHVTGGFGSRGHFVANPGGNGGIFIPSPPLATTPTGAQIAGMLNPANLLEGLRVWIVGHGNPDARTVPYPSTLGGVYLIATIGLTAICVLLMIRRYQKASLL